MVQRCGVRDLGERAPAAASTLVALAARGARPNGVRHAAPDLVLWRPLQVWGTWNGIVPRDGEAIRRVGAMLRALGGSAAILRSSEWVPHTPQVSQDGVYASLFPADANTKWPGLRNAWSLVNRAGRHVRGVVLVLTPVDAKSRFYDCYRGVEILIRRRAQPSHVPRATAELAGTGPLAAVAAADERVEAAEGTAVDLELQIEMGGFGCVVETDGAAAIPLARFLALMRTMSHTPLAAFSSRWTRLQQTMVPVGRTACASSAPAGMVRVPAASNWELIVRGVEIEGGDEFGTDVQFPWEEEPMGRSTHGHRHTFDRLGPFYMDKHPVTNANYSAYLAATRYAPADPVSWLRHWNGSATPPPAIADAPVVYVSLAEARAYCEWAGARLPHSWEWQYAAQGADGRLYPWGNNKSATGALPVLHSGRANPGPPLVGAHSPAGDSPFGVADLVGTVWQYTDEFHDEHTRAVILRGGSNYRPAGSRWCAALAGHAYYRAQGGKAQCSRGALAPMSLQRSICHGPDLAGAHSTPPHHRRPLLAAGTFPTNPSSIRTTSIFSSPIATSAPAPSDYVASWTPRTERQMLD